MTTPTAEPPTPGSRGTVTLQLVGTFTVRVDGVVLSPPQLGSRRGRLLLQLLCVERPSNLTVDKIAAAVWPEGAPSNVDAAVATLVSRLRAVLGKEVVVGRRGTYRLGDPAAVEVDLDAAAALVDEAERHVDTEPGIAASAANRAIELLGSGVLTDFRYVDWAAPAQAEHAVVLRRARLAAARALVLGGDPADAMAVAEDLVAADPLDEAARRALMSASAAAGEPARALGTYDELRALLRDGLGIDPSHATQDLYLAVLRAEPEVPVERSDRQAAGPADAPDGLVGRASELASLRTLWESATWERPGMVVITGESGIGKTRLAEEFASAVSRTGGSVLRARCYEAERALFMQPVLDAVEAELARSSPAAVRALVGPDAAELAVLMPMLERMLTVQGPAGGSDAIRRRRYFEAVTGLLARLAARAPVLLLVDDVQNAGRSTLEMVHYLVLHVGPARLLVVLTARVEASDAWRRLLPDSTAELALGPLSDVAVRELAARAGHESLADRIVRLTGGHTLYVVEVLRAVSAGSQDLPLSLRATVLARVHRAGPAIEALLRAGAVVGNRLEPEILSPLVGVDVPEAVARCEQALSQRLLVVDGPAYEFAHDAVREVLYATTPAPTLASLHRRAADLLSDRPEALAAHAAAVGDWNRAARAWLLAADDAMRALAAADATSLADRAVDAAQTAGLVDVQARALLLRGRAREVTAEYAEALVDFERAAALASAAGDDRLHMLALRELGGDVPTALGVPVDQHSRHLAQALKIAESLGDRVMQPELLSRMAVVETNRLQFVEALQHARSGVAKARRDDPRALAIALDGLKTVYAYLGDIEGLMPVVSELSPLLRRQNDQWRLQWLVFESAFEPLAAGRFDDAMGLVEQALQLNRASGYVSYEAWFLAHLGWMHRLRGDLDRALDVGRRAVRHADRFGHAWWAAATSASLAVTLLERGDRAEAVRLLDQSLKVAETTRAEGYLARCLGPLALATGSRDLLERSDALLRGVSCPPGSAWLLGADAYLTTARAWLAYDESRAGDLLGPFVAAAARSRWAPLLDAAAAVVPAAT